MVSTRPMVKCRQIPHHPEDFHCVIDQTSNKAVVVDPRDVPKVVSGASVASVANVELVGVITVGETT